MYKIENIKVNSFVYCLSFFPQKKPDGKESLVLDGIISSINPEYVPGMFSFAMIVGLIGIDFSRRQKLNVKFLNATTRKSILDLPNIELSENMFMNNGLNFEVLSVDKAGVNMNIDARNIVFHEEGWHVTEIEIDNQLIGEYPIYVKGVNRNEHK